MRSLLGLAMSSGMALALANCGGVNLDPLRGVDGAVDTGSPPGDAVVTPDTSTPVDAGPGACRTDADCASAQECVYASSACAASGTCMDRVACVRAETFCSCSGVTYQGCRPSQPTRAVGACDATIDGGVVDAGPGGCRSNADCPTAQYCAGAGCGTAGTCAARPEVCTEVYAPVCGCDGVTYSNSCAAAGAGVRAATLGACGAIDGGVVDSGIGFCAAALCPTGTRCCEASRSCLPPGVLCGPPVDGGVVDSGVGFCATALCPSGTRCCEASRSCLPGGVACVPPVDSGVIDAGPASCTRAADCGAGQECVFASAGCTTTGTCMAAVACLRAETFCSCAGVTYSGCRPDRPTRAVGPCGTPVDAGVDAGPVTCRADSDCASGQSCCGATGRCYASACLACCMFPVDAGPAACRSNADCASTQYCAASACGAAGTCQARPEACTTLYAPVCGCDGATYSNACMAAAGGQNVASTGACSSFCAMVRCTPTTYCCEAARACIPMGAACIAPTDGGVIDAGPAGCATAADCGSGQECVFANTGCATRGTCMAAIACLRAETFCSCTGVTYSGCRPDRPTRAVGACDGTVDAGTPACRSDADCGSGLACCPGTGRCYDTRCLACCMPTVSSCTRAADCASGQECVFDSTGCATTGTCQAAIACLRAETYCSCAGVTYSGCRPDRPTRAVGACGGTTGSCTRNAECATGQYCAGTGCGTSGMCAARPSVCSDLYSPVCGCDGVTYPNACNAAGAGARVSYTGVCR